MRRGFMVVRGKVIAGMGDGKNFTSLPWFKEQVVELFNFEPYPGTLNVLLAEDTSKFLLRLFNEKKGFRIIPGEGHFSGLLYKALICSRVMGAVVRPCVPKYPERMLEIIAPICLREFLGLNDGDEIDVGIFFR